MRNGDFSLAEPLGNPKTRKKCPHTSVHCNTTLVSTHTECFSKRHVREANVGGNTEDAVAVVVEVHQAACAYGLPFELGFAHQHRGRTALNRTPHGGRREHERGARGVGHVRRAGARGIWSPGSSGRRRRRCERFVYVFGHVFRTEHGIVSPAVHDKLGLRVEFFF